MARCRFAAGVVGLHVRSVNIFKNQWQTADKDRSSTWGGGVTTHHFEHLLWGPLQSLIFSYFQ